METAGYMPNITNVIITENPTLVQSVLIIDVDINEVLKSIHEYIDEISIGDEIGVI